MTTPLFATRDALAEVLAAHATELNGSTEGCECGWYRDSWDAPTHSEHVADVLAGVVRDPSTLDDARETLRQEMLRQPMTDGRDTYSDGYGQGLARAIGVFDAALTGDPSA